MPLVLALLLQSWPAWSNPALPRELSAGPVDRRCPVRRWVAPGAQPPGLGGPAGGAGSRPG